MTVDEEYQLLKSIYTQRTSLLHALRLKMNKTKEDYENRNGDWVAYTFWRTKYEMLHDECVNNNYLY